MPGTSIIYSRLTLEGERSPDCPDFRGELVYGHRSSHDAGDHVPAHRHPRWQMEINLSGRQRVTVNSKVFILETNDYIIIPPRATHRLDYFTPSESVSIKFALAAAAPDGRPPKAKAIAAFSTIERLNALTRDLMEKRDDLRALGTALLGRLLDCYLAFYFIDPAPEAKAPGESLKARIVKTLENAEGARLKVKDLAEKLGYSPNYLSSLFRDVYRENLKDYLNDKAVEAACNLLAYSELPIHRIAEKMRFPDYHSFSHFFKRETGDSPKDYRDKIKTARDERDS